MKAKNVRKGDWVKVGGKPVKVTDVEDTGWWTLGGFVEGVGISYKGGSKSGMLRRGKDSQVTHLAGKPPRR
jgi:hypothetical protein